jgi:conjugal transfer pilus assembly protein TraF
MSKNRHVKWSLLVALFLGNFSHATDDFSKVNNPEGWYFYKEKPAPVEVEEEPQPTPPPPPPPAPVEEEVEEEQEVVIDSKWLRINLPILLEEAQDNPTFENVRRYQFAQRLAVDKATIFADVYREVALRETILSEDLRRPTSNSETLALGNQILKSREELYREYSKQFGLYFFYASTCSYCHLMTTIIEQFINVYGMEIIPVSIDGADNNMSPKLKELTVFDDGRLTQVMPVEITPTFYLVNIKTMAASNIAVGYQTKEEFDEAILRGLRDTGVIGEGDYQRNQPVKDIYIAEEVGEESIKVKESELYSNPDYLADKLKSRFKKKYMSSDSEVQIQGLVIQESE